MRKENKFLVTAWESIAEIVVIFDDDKNPYIYSYIDGDEFYRFEENEKIFDNKEQAEEYVRENIIPFDKNKVKEYLTKRYEVNSIREMEDILPDSIIKKFSRPFLHICDLGWIQCDLLRNALKGIFCISAITFRKEEVAYIKHGEDDWVEITLKDGTKVTPRNEDENLIIRWYFGGNPSGAHYTNIKKTCGNTK